MTFPYLPWSAERDPSAAALDDDQSSHTYGELDAWSAAVAGQLADRGFGAGKVLAVMLPNRAELVVAMLAGWRLGGVVTPINPSFTATEAEFQINDCDAHLVINASPDSPDGGRPTIHVADLAVPGEGPAPVELSEGDVALLIYTSGSTGKPKGVILDHGNIAAQTADFVEAYEITADDHCLLVLPLFHVNALTLNTLCPLSVGGRITIVGKFSVSRFFEQVENVRPTYTAVVPTILAMLVSLPEDVQPDTSSLRYAICGAAPLSEDLLTRSRERFGMPILEGYGLTEATCCSTGNPLHGPRKVGTVGMPVGCQRVQVVSRDGQALPAGERGEVVVAGPTVMRGYVGQPEATSKALVDGWLHTGDIGVFDDDGYLSIVGRIKDLIIRGGENIYPKEIESVLTGIDGVLEAAVVGKPDDVLGEVPVAYVQAYPGADLDPDRMIEHCAQRLASHKVPELITLMAALPKNPVGKIDKPELRRAAAQAVDSSV